MIEIFDPITFNFENVPIDPFWNVGTERELLMHRIHAYPAKFPSFITTKAIEYAIQHSIDVKTIADIFCGCGTAAYEAKRNNINFWGCDINPVATMIARTKSAIYNTDELEVLFNKIVADFIIKPNNDYYPNANQRLKYWYKKDQFNELTNLKSSIFENTTEGSKYFDFFICAFSNILKPTSMWLTKSIKPQYDPNKKPADVLSSFKKQCNFMIFANSQNREGASISKIETNNFLEAKNTPNIDLLITSPPYVTSYEYADLHQLSSLWLDYTDDYRELRKGSIGSLYNEYNFSREFKKLNTSANKIVSRLLDKKNKKAKSIAKYFLDMQNVTKKTFRMINKNGLALFVVGNTEYQGVIINNAKHLSESLIDAGFISIEITKRKISKKNLTPYRDALGKFSSYSKGREIYNEEFIIIGRK